MFRLDYYPNATVLGRGFLPKGEKGITSLYNPALDEVCNQIKRAYPLSPTLEKGSLATCIGTSTITISDSFPRISLRAQTRAGLGTLVLQELLERNILLPFDSREIVDED